MSSEEIRQRADLIGTPVVTRDTAKRLGIVSQLWVDIDQQEVVAISLRPSIFYGTPQPMLLSSIRQIGDVILVDNEDVLEEMDVEIYTPLTNCEVITETGELLGKVRGYKFDIDSGRLTSIIVAALGLPLIPDQVVSTYELSIDEVVSSGPDRLIVFEGSEERLQQLSVGVLERLGIGRAPWEKEFDTISAAPVRSDNQLGTGLRTPIRTELKQREPQRQELRQEWDEDNWEDTRSRREEPRRMQQYYEDDESESDNWSEASGGDRYQSSSYPTSNYPDDRYDDDYDDDLDQDPWQEPKVKQRPEPVQDAEVIVEKSLESRPESRSESRLESPLGGPPDSLNPTEPGTPQPSSQSTGPSQPAAFEPSIQPPLDAQPLELPTREPESQVLKQPEYEE